MNEYYYELKLLIEFQSAGFSCPQEVETYAKIGGCQNPGRRKDKQFLENWRNLEQRLLV